MLTSASQQVKRAVRAASPAAKRGFASFTNGGKDGMKEARKIFVPAAGKTAENSTGALQQIRQPQLIVPPPSTNAPKKLLVPTAAQLRTYTNTRNSSTVAAASVGSAGPHVLNRGQSEDIDAWANDTSNAIIPKFWMGDFNNMGWKYEDISIDASKMNLEQYMIRTKETVPGTNKVVEVCKVDMDAPFIKELKARMEGIFKDHGVVYMRETGFKAPAELRAVMEICEIESMVYEGGANMRPAIDGSEHINVYETGAPKEGHIHYHHEMAYVNESCRWIGFMARSATEDPMNGATYLSEQVKATDEIMSTPLGDKLKEKGICYVRKLPDKKYFDDNNLDPSIVYNFWQTSMLTEDMDEAEEVAKKVGLEVEWQDSPVFGRYMVTKNYISAFEHCPYTDKNLMFSSIADDYMWFDRWPGVMDLPHHERPLKLNFGDDSIMTREEKQLYVDVYDHHGMPVPWKQGDFALCCNFRTAHGRPAYSLKEGEQRDLGVVLGNLYSRRGDNPEKW